MNLVQFNRKGGRYTNPRVSITTAGQFGLNSACLERYFKGKKYVILYGDKENRIIGIKPIEKSTDTAFSISFSANRTSGSISGHSFLNFLEFDYSKSRKFTPEWNEKEGMLIIKVN